MKREILTSEKIFLQPTKFADLLVDSSGYVDLHEKLSSSDLEYSDDKVFEVAPSGFVDFNQHLYEDINHMNSISCGIYLERSLITFRIFLWGSRGDGFEIFKHVLRGDEIDSLKSIEDIKFYMHKHLEELEDGILKTYSMNARHSFEQLGMGIESKKLPLHSILQFMSIDNNLSDFR
ncbi:Uncharacterised protein [[Clostridium] sordellii]|uniref:hypothetical protein n=1 Tax=Paraclostridium sordellii TaxID=1505 RepID=UPI0005E7303B|nr:hypothetical protein [Paeniclostridium sordellii]CEP95809.1 Uncharacterised protein [[Clostridium] sordellii] [Paeniclostridium sordellii]